MNTAKDEKVLPPGERFSAKEKMFSSPDEIILAGPKQFYPPKNTFHPPAKIFLRRMK